MPDAQKLEARIRFDTLRGCFFRWEHCNRARMAAATTSRIYGKNSWQKKAQVSFQAPNNRGRLPSSLDFSSRISFEKKFADCHFGGGDQESGSTRGPPQSVACFFYSEQVVSHANTICCCFSGRVRFATFPAQPEFYGYVSPFCLYNRIDMAEKFI